MTVGMMRTLDRFLGVPFCWATSLWFTITRLSRGVVPQGRIQGVLVMKFFGLGSILLSTPFLLALRRHVPEARIFYLTFSSNEELLDKLPVTFERLTISTLSLMDFFRDTLKLLRTLRRHRVDIVFDLEFFSKFSTLLSALSGATMRVGYELPTRWRIGNLTHPIRLDRGTHVTRMFMQQLSILGISELHTFPPPRLTATTRERASMERKLKLGQNGVDIICVNINAGDTSLERRWKPDRFMKVAEAMITTNPSTRLMFIGNAGERNYVRQVLHSRPVLRHRVRNCAGELTIGELIALFERSSLLLTNDSGPLHIANAVGTPVVALFGPESPRFYGPLGNPRIVYKNLSCSPCLNIYNAKVFRCPYNALCMNEISVEEVLTAIESIRISEHTLDSDATIP